MPEFSCVLCNHAYPIDTGIWRCECGGVLEMTDLPAFDREAVVGDDYSLWRYRHLLAFEKEEHIVSMGEGFTPLVAINIYGVPVLAKAEYMSPTGSYKDRGASVLVSFLKGFKKFDWVVEDSSGNAGASLAAYAARLGVKARVFVPADASGPKLNQISIHGAELYTVEGPRSAVEEAAHAAAEKGYYASHVYNPLFMTGLRTFAYEVAEQLGWKAPNNIIFPVGHGTLLVGTYRGFQDMLAAEVIDHMPRFFAVQARTCDPIFQAFRRGFEDVQPTAVGHTIAEGIRIAQPPRGRQVLEAIRETEGSVLTVTDREVARARRAMARLGLFIEPTSAVAVAGLRKLDKMLDSEEVTVMPLTGSGLKVLVT
ncbi:MAG: threonine synthase [Anaerolineae bacterium]